ncbi:hypothetical protein IWQ57_004116, partial [Coemansia nantahalensis]
DGRADGSGIRDGRHSSAVGPADTAADPGARQRGSGGGLYRAPGAGHAVPVGRSHRGALHEKVAEERWPADVFRPKAAAGAAGRGKARLAAALARGAAGRAAIGGRGDDGRARGQRAGPRDDGDRQRARQKGADLVAADVGQPRHRGERGAQNEHGPRVAGDCAVLRPAARARAVR